jgi:hypothetical protein
VQSANTDHLRNEKTELINLPDAFASASKASIFTIKSSFSFLAILNSPFNVSILAFLRFNDEMNRGCGLYERKKTSRDDT